MPVIDPKGDHAPHKSTPHKSPRLPEESTPAALTTPPHRTLTTKKDSEDCKDLEDLERHIGSRTASRYDDDDPALLLSLSLPKYLEWAVKYTEWESEDKYEHGEQWHSPMFAFTRLCKAHPALAGLDDVAAIKTVDKALREMLGNEPHVDPW